VLLAKTADKKNLPVLAQWEAKNQAECYEEDPLEITTPGGSYKFFKKLAVEMALSAKLSSMEG